MLSFYPKEWLLKKHFSLKGDYFFCFIGFTEGLIMLRVTL